MRRSKPQLLLLHRQQHRLMRAARAATIDPAARQFRLPGHGFAECPLADWLRR